jgi:hypothetical protein
LRHHLVQAGSQPSRLAWFPVPGAARWVALWHRWVISDTVFDLVFDALHHGLELADTELAASPAAGTW